jgi:hypothetical protein
MQRREAMMKSVSPVSLSLADPIVVDANINELERRIRELTDRVKALEEAGKANKPVDFATMYVPEDRVKERIADARLDERRRAAGIVREVCCHSAVSFVNEMCKRILDGPDAQTQEIPRYTQADLDAAVEKDRERCVGWFGKYQSSFSMTWDEMIQHILNGDQVPA